ncbi:MAG: phenylacetate--CoA ligase family protein [Theionarchaea archaeon]|nr:phenylacetate--CoA ligase family protein [Theionarchaea archaeon]MBU7036616.1 phenylacetate--CoA ligase family protein [Theionarchaea archaeon]
MWKAFAYVPVAYKTQYASPEYVKRFQEKRMRYIVRFAYRNTLLYKEKFRNAGINPWDIKTLDDLKKIPFTSKAEIKEGYPVRSVAAGFSEENCSVELTSGASGSVLRVLHDPYAVSRMRAVSLRSHLAQGVRPWHKFCILCRDPEEYELYENMSFLRTQGIMEGRSDTELVKEIEKERPYILAGHPSAMVALAHAAERSRVRSNPRMILLGGELSLPWHRAYIERIFNCPTYNKYGAYEMISIAWECKHHSMHIDVDGGIVEFLRDGEAVAPGERGEIVVTNLWNRAMPFIRYRLQDIGIPSDEPCQCGRTLPVLKDIEGRCDDFIVSPSGELIPPTRLIAHFFSIPHIKQFRVTQNTCEHITVQVIPHPSFTVELENLLVTNVKCAVGSDVTVEFERVDHIPETGRGKFRTVVSHVKVDLAHKPRK